MSRSSLKTPNLLARRGPLSLQILDPSVKLRNLGLRRHFGPGQMDGHGSEWLIYFKTSPLVLLERNVEYFLECDLASLEVYFLHFPARFKPSLRVRAR